MPAPVESREASKVRHDEKTAHRIMFLTSSYVVRLRFKTRSESDLSIAQTTSQHISTYMCLFFCHKINNSPTWGYMYIFLRDQILTVWTNSMALNPVGEIQASRCRDTKREHPIPNFSRGSKGKTPGNRYVDVLVTNAIRKESTSLSCVFQPSCA